MTSPTALLHTAVERFDAIPDLDEDAKAVLKRLLSGDDDRAAEAFAAIADDPGTASLVVRCCLECEAVYRTFHQTVSAEMDNQARFAALITAVDSLGKFVRERGSEPKHPQIDAYVALEAHQADNWLLTLGEIRGAIEARRHVAAETPLRLGMTRNWKQESAREIAALGWFAEGIERVFGQPHYQHVAALAEIVLQIEEIDEDRVRHALGVRRGRDWHSTG